MKNIKQRIWSSIKAGWNLPSLPPHIIKLDNNIYIRILKIIGPFTIFIFISGFIKQINDDKLFYLIFFVSLLYIFYKYIIAFYAIKQWFHYLFNGEFIVRNSPLDPLSIMIKASFNLLKQGAKASVGAGMAYALCHELDDILEKEGKDPYFVPKLKDGIKKLGLDNKLKETLTFMGISETNNKDPLKNIFTIYEQLNPEEIANFEKETGLKYEDGSKVLKYIQEKDSKTVTQEVKELIDKNDPFNNKK